MALREMLRTKQPMEIEKAEGKADGKRQSEAEQQGSPSKRRQGGKPAQTSPKGKGRGKQKEAPEGRNEQSLLRAMSALTLRHEDSINVLQADLSFISYLETPGKMTASAIPTLVQVKDEHQQGADTRPLRQKLFLALMDYFVKQIQKVVANTELVQAGVKDGIIKLEGSSQVLFAYQRWDSEKNELVLESNMQPMHIKDMLVTVREISTQGEQAGAISRFTFSRAITKDMSGGPVRVQIQISQLSDPSLRSQMMKLVGCTAWAFIGANLRSGDVRRSPLAVQVERLTRKEVSSSTDQS